MPFPDSEAVFAAYGYKWIVHSHYILFEFHDKIVLFYCILLSDML